VVQRLLPTAGRVRWELGTVPIGLPELLAGWLLVGWLAEWLASCCGGWLDSWKAGWSGGWSAGCGAN